MQAQRNALITLLSDVAKPAKDKKKDKAPAKKDAKKEAKEEAADTSSLEEEERNQIAELEAKVKAFRDRVAGE